MGETLPTQNLAVFVGGLDAEATEAVADRTTSDVGGPLCPEEPLWIDAEAFEAAAATARRTRDTEAQRTALSLSTGDLLPEDQFAAKVSVRDVSGHLAAVQ